MPDVHWPELWRESVEQSLWDWAWQNPHTIPLGFWLARRRKGAAEIPCAIWRADYEPDNPQNKLDAPILVAAIAGKLADPIEVYALLLRGRREITEKAYAARTGEFQWVSEFGSEDDPLKHPERRPDFNKLKPQGPE